MTCCTLALTSLRLAIWRLEDWVGRGRKGKRLTIPHGTGYPTGKQSVYADGARTKLTAKGTGEACEDAK